MIFDDLSNAACRLSLGGPGAELEGRGVQPPGPARVAPSTGPARVKVEGGQYLPSPKIFQKFAQISLKFSQYLLKFTQNLHKFIQNFPKFTQKMMMWVRGTYQCNSNTY